MAKILNIAVIGATGTVGSTLIELLENRNFPVNKLFPIASNNSICKTVFFKKSSLNIIDINKFDFKQADLVFFMAGSEISLKFIPIAIAAGCFIIDNSSAFRYEESIPLVIPEINGQLISSCKSRLIANPNCSTIQMLMAINPIYELVGIKRINVATYQAVAGQGQLAIQELAEQTGELLNGRSISKKIFPKQIAFNVLPQIDSQQDNGYTREEMKMFWETQKIFNNYNIQVNATAVRVPVFFGHSEAIHLETTKQFELTDIKSAYHKVDGIELFPDNEHPTPLDLINNPDKVLVGRMRRDVSSPQGLNLWCVTDSVRKGGALNSLQIAELAFEKSVI